MKLKGVEQLNKVINEFLAPFEATADMGIDFAYWTDTDHITYSMVITDTNEDYFMQNFHKIAPDINCDPFLAALMHELGHHMTMHILDEEEIVYCRDVKDILQNKMDNWKLNDEEIKDLHQAYFDLPIETEATLWAIEYMREHADKMKSFWNEKLRPAIIKFYTVNNITVKEYAI